MTDRTDQLSGLVEELGGALLGPGFKGVSSGWLAPETAWAFYWQNGTIRQMVNRFVTLMVKAGWDYTGANVKFNWSGVQSSLETKRIKQQMRQCATWAFVFGGGAIEHIVDDADRGRDEELVLANVREYKGIRVWSAYDLRPESGRNYKTAEWFVPRYRHGDRTRIHRSRLSLMLATEVPVANLGSSLFINTRTGWPPSWLEGVYDEYCDWSRAHLNATQIMRSKSILHLMLDGYQIVSQSPDSVEAKALGNKLTQILNDLDNTGMLITDVTSKLEEVERSLAGISDVLERKSLRAASAAGVPKELFIMEAEGNLGTDSAPYDAYNDMVDGWREVMTTPTIERSTDIELHVERYNARLQGEALVIPTEYTVTHRPIQEQSDKERAQTRKDDSIARNNDGERLPLNVWLSDPGLARDFPDLEPFLETQREAAKTAEAASIEAEADDPAGEDMVSAGEVARRLNLSPATINKMATAGALPGRKIAGRWKFYMSRVITAIKGLSTPGTLGDVRILQELADEFWGPGMRVDADLGLSDNTKFGDAFGASVAMREIFAVLERIAASDLSVLLLGETGTGKEGIARGLHSGGEFVAVNCAALPADLADLDEFMAGEIDRAKGGTLFLDELGDLPMPAQSALLVALNDVEARLVSATSLDVRDPENFRPDLFHRLTEIEVEIPPLRDRESDVHELAGMFYAKHTKAAGITPADPPFTEPALAAMLIYQWPGNVRELLNAVARGATLAGHAKSVGPEHLQLRMTGRA